jgi:hypothetical protein
MNAKEYFATIASLYLGGKLARVPFTREKLKQMQPPYYDWLGTLFGVQK